MFIHNYIHVPICCESSYEANLMSTYSIEIPKFWQRIFYILSCVVLLLISLRGLGKIELKRSTTVSWWFVRNWLTCGPSIQWRHNEPDGVSNHQPYHCLLICLFRRRSKKTSKLRDTGLCAGNSPVTGELPAQMASNAEDVSIWWRHHASIYGPSHLTRMFSTRLTHTNSPPNNWWLKGKLYLRQKDKKRITQQVTFVIKYSLFQIR